MPLVQDERQNDKPGLIPGVHIVEATRTTTFDSGRKAAVILGNSNGEYWVNSTVSNPRITNTFGLIGVHLPPESPRNLLTVADAALKALIGKKLRIDLVHATNKGQFMYTDEGEPICNLREIDLMSADGQTVQPVQQAQPVQPVQQVHPAPVRQLPVQQTRQPKFDPYTGQPIDTGHFLDPNGYDFDKVPF